MTSKRIDDIAEDSFYDSDEEFPSEIEVAQLGQGKTFGDNALMHNRPRNATIKCLTPTVCGILNRKDFN